MPLFALWIPYGISFRSRWNYVSEPALTCSDTLIGHIESPNVPDLAVHLCLADGEFTADAVSAPAMTTGEKQVVTISSASAFGPEVTVHRLSIKERDVASPRLRP